MPGKTCRSWHASLLPSRRSWFKSFNRAGLGPHYCECMFWSNTECVPFLFTAHSQDWQEVAIWIGQLALELGRILFANSFLMLWAEESSIVLEQ